MHAHLYLGNSVLADTKDSCFWDLGSAFLVWGCLCAASMYACWGALNEAGRVSAGDGSWSIFSAGFQLTDQSVKDMKQTALWLLSDITTLGIKKPELSSSFLPCYCCEEHLVHRRLIKHCIIVFSYLRFFFFTDRSKFRLQSLIILIKSRL